MSMLSDSYPCEPPTKGAFFLYECLYDFVLLGAHALGPEWGTHPDCVGGNEFAFHPVFIRKDLFRISFFLGFKV